MDFTDVFRALMVILSVLTLFVVIAVVIKGLFPRTYNRSCDWEVVLRHALDVINRNVVIIGFLLGIYLSFQFRHISEKKTLEQEVYRRSYSFGQEDTSQKIWFVMSTKFDKEQEPGLVRIAQALYPSRSKIKWIIVNTDTQMQDHNAHLTYLNSVIQRFSIPYVLLSMPPAATTPPFSWMTWLYRKYFQRKVLEVRPRDVGIFWAFQNAAKGVLIVGHEKFTYHYRLFIEALDTRKISVWPVELAPINTSLHFVKEPNIKSCNFEALYDLPISLSGLAVNIEYFRQHYSLEDVSKLNSDFVHEILKLAPSTDIEPLKSCSKIFVWRTSPYSRILKERFPLNPDFRNTNGEFLLRYIYRERFDDNICLDCVTVQTNGSTENVLQESTLSDILKLKS